MRQTHHCAAVHVDRGAYGAFPQQGQRKRVDLYGALLLQVADSAVWRLCATGDVKDTRWCLGQVERADASGAVKKMRLVSCRVESAGRVGSEKLMSQLPTSSRQRCRQEPIQPWHGLQRPGE